MTLVVPSHISLPTLPTQQLDIAYNPAPASDPATPRAVLTHAAIDLVAAAVTIAPSLSPALPAEKSEYCLSSKRKTIDDDPLDIPRIAKRVKSDDDVLFGPLVPDTTVLQVSPDADLVQTAIFEQALAAIFSCSSSQDVDPSPVTDHPEPSHASPSRTARSPLATSIITASSIESIEAPAPVARPLPRMPSPPRNRIVEPPLWKMACRMRVDQLISMHGGHAIRAAVAQEYRPPSPVAYSVDEPSVPRRLSPTIVDSSESKLELEIITPVSYPQSPDHCDKEETSISDAESDIDMSFDLDDDSDTDSDSEEDADIDILSAHESILDVPVTERIAVEDTDYPTPTSEAESDAASFLPPPITLPLPIAIPSALPSWPPRLPRLSSIRAYCLREYPQMPPRGTPAQNSPYARGSLLPTCCQFAMSRSSDGMPLL